MDYRKFIGCQNWVHSRDECAMVLDYFEIMDLTPLDDLHYDIHLRIDKGGLLLL